MIRIDEEVEPVIRIPIELREHRILQIYQSTGGRME